MEKFQRKKNVLLCLGYRRRRVGEEGEGLVRRGVGGAGVEDLVEI